MRQAIEKESAIERYLVSQVEALGGMALKVAIINQRGFFDRLVILPQRVIFVETKRPKRSTTSPQQKYMHQRFAELGAEVAVLRTREGVDTLLSRR